MAKWIPIYFIKQYLFWMLLFQLLRIVFLFFNFNEIDGAGIIEVLKAFWYSIPLDSSTACYILGFPFILLFFQSLLSWKGFYIVNLWYSYILIFVSVLISVGELPLYREWHVKMNFKAISYFQHPSEVFQTASWFDLLWGILALVILSAFVIFMYRKYIHVRFVVKKRNYFVSLIFFLSVPFLIGVGIRGGIQPIPLHQSDCYYSKNNFLNLTAVNSQWNLLASITKNYRYKNSNPFLYYPLSEAQNTVDSLYTVEKDTTQFILTTQRPNIVLILLESYSADLIHSLGGYDSLSPNFEKLVSEGILFTRTYTSGTLSDQGIAAVLCGYPTLPTVIVVNQPDKYIKLPCLSRDLKRSGYYTSFMFGGQLSYGNIKGLIYYNKFDDIYEGKDFPNTIPQGRLGVHDHYMLEHWLGRISSYPQPFFAAAFTLSSHSPYDQPFPEKFQWGGNERQYINSAYYTDSCLGDFFSKAKKQPWYNNTLFVLVADHSHGSPRNWDYYSHDYRHIPLLLFGSVLKPEVRGTKQESLCSQTDLAATLLAQLDIPHKHYHWSKNVYNKYSKPFAFYASDAASGWISANGYCVFEYGTENFYQRWFPSSNDSIKAVRQGKSYLECLFQEYLEF